MFVGVTLKTVKESSGIQKMHKTENWGKKKSETALRTVAFKRLAWKSIFLETHCPSLTSSTYSVHFAETPAYSIKMPFDTRHCQIVKHAILFNSKTASSAKYALTPTTSCALTSPLDTLFAHHSAQTVPLHTHKNNLYYSSEADENSCDRRKTQPTESQTNR